MWPADPKFVGSFDVDDYVYFFFRENALEHAGCGKLVFSRVARICKVIPHVWKYTESVNLRTSDNGYTHKSNCTDNENEL